MRAKANGSDPEETLLTKRSLQLSLSPPRCPPYGTAHRSVLAGTSPFSDPYVEHHGDDQAHSAYNKHSAIGKGGIRERVMHLVYNANFSVPHPHLSVAPEGGDKVTRFLGTILPLSWQNYCRDSGGFRSISDRLVTSSMPFGAMANPGAALDFLRLTRKVHSMPYGKHESQFIDMFFPECSREEMTGMVFFVHGGAWGGGKPLFYRLIALPFLKMKLAVAIVGYRVYPMADANTQVNDLNSAYRELWKRYPDLCGPSRTKRQIGFCVVGHSSGAHIGLLMIVEELKRLMHVEQSKVESPENKLSITTIHTPIDKFVGISGPYDISQHFDYEASRGVEELSPMKAANGYTREQFRLNSPALRLQDFLISIPESEKLSPDNFFPDTLLIHGILDSTVPFTATSEAARVLKSCGVKKLVESYIPLTGHQDAVMHLMLGGRVQNSIVRWLRSGGSQEMPHSRL